MTRVPGQPVSDIEGGFDMTTPEQLSVLTITMRNAARGQLSLNLRLVGW